METIKFKFSFPLTSLEYGEFLIDYYVKYQCKQPIENLLSIGNVVNLSITVDEDIGLLLKLKFGKFIKEDLLKLKILKPRIPNEFFHYIDFKNNLKIKELDE